MTDHPKGAGREIYRFWHDGVYWDVVIERDERGLFVSTVGEAFKAEGPHPNPSLEAYLNPFANP